MKEYIGIITALFGLMTAWLTYRTVARKSVSDPLRQQIVRAVLDPTVDLKQWTAKKHLTFGLLGVLAYFLSGASPKLSLLIRSRLRILHRPRSDSCLGPCFSCSEESHCRG